MTMSFAGAYGRGGAGSAGWGAYAWRVEPDVTSAIGREQ